MNNQGVIIGAGNIGRGLNAFILQANDYNFKFLDVSNQLINQINTEKSYYINFLDNQTNPYKIHGYSGLNLMLEFQECVAAIAKSNLVLISIGLQNLPKIIKLLTSAIELKEQNNNNSHLNIIAVENGVKSSDILKSLAQKELKNQTLLSKLNISFPNCAVDRIVPNQLTNDLSIAVEPFYELIIDEKKWLGKKLQHVIYSQNIDKFIERKIFMLNATHAAIAWYGLKHNYKYIYEFNNHAQAKLLVTNLLNTFSKILELKFDFSQAELSKYSKVIIKRLSNSNIKDEVTRVGRGVMRKLAPQDRFLLPLRYCLENNLNADSILKCIALPFSGLMSIDQELSVLNENIQNYGLKQTIEKSTGITNEKIISKIIQNIKL